MKKRIKSVFCAFLALVMLVSAMPIFATAAELVDSATEDSSSIGQAQLGDNSIAYVGDRFSDICVDFDVEKSGYYCITTQYNENGREIFIDSVWLEDSRVTEYDRIYSDAGGKGTDKYIFKTEQGEAQFLIDPYDDIDGYVNFKIEYMGSEVTDIGLLNGTEKNNLLECDFSHEGEYGTRFTYEFYCDFYIMFDSVNRFEFDDCTLKVYSDKKLEAGENNIALSFFGFEKETTVTVCELSDLIEKVELEGKEKGASIIYYTGRIYGDYKGIENTNLVVTYSDGTKATFSPDEKLTVTPEGNRKYRWYIEIDYDILLIFIETYYLIERVPCEIREATREENLEYYKKNVGNYIESAKRQIYREFDRLFVFAYTPWDYYTDLRDALIGAGDIVAVTVNKFVEDTMKLLATL